MRIGDTVKYDAEGIGTICRVFPDGSLDACEVITRSARGELLILTLRAYDETLVSTDRICRTIPSDYAGLTVPQVAQVAHGT
jgi:hypothetical protein